MKTQKRSANLPLCGLLAWLVLLLPARAEFYTGECSYSVTDQSPDAWTLTVNFVPQQTDGGFFTCFGSQVTVANPPAGFQPFMIRVSGTNNVQQRGQHTLYAEFYPTPTGKTGSYGVMDLHALPTGTTLLPGTGTLLGFEGVTVTLFRESGRADSPMTVTVRFGNTPCDAFGTRLREAAGMIEQWAAGNPAIQGLSAKIETILAKVCDGNLRSACNVLDAFLNQVDAEARNGTLSLEQEQILRLLAEDVAIDLGC